MIYPHTFGYYRVSYDADDSAGETRLPEIVAEGIKCFFQDDESEKTAFPTAHEVKLAYIYFTDTAVYDDIEFDDVIEVDDVKYKITSKENFAGLNRVYGLKVRQDVVGDI